MEFNVKTRSIMSVVIALLLLFAVPISFAQSTVQPRMGLEPLDPSTATLFVAPNGAKLMYGYNVEDITLATGGTTTDSTGYLLPAGAMILSVTGTVTTTITAGCTGWQLGDATTAGRFTASNTTLTAGTTDVGKVHFTTGVASATTGMWQAAAAKVRITCATAAPGAGKVRVAVTYLKFVPPLP